MAWFKKKRWADLSSAVESEGIQTVTNQPLLTGLSFQRWQALTVVGILSGSLFFLRAFQLQIMQGSALRDQSELNRLNTVWTDAPRGRIEDARGIVLADTTTAFTLWIQPVFFQETVQQPSRIAWLSKRLQVETESLQESLPVPLDTKQPVRWRLSIPHTSAIALLAEQDTQSWYTVSVGPARSYLETSLHSFSHVLGTVGRISAEEWPEARVQGYRTEDWIGKTGLEAVYESSLRGFPGVQRQEVDVLGRVKATVETRPPETGATLVLGLDSELQQEIERLAERAMNTIGKKKMAIIAMDPRSGSVRALVSLPSFNANLLLTDPKYYGRLVTDSAQPLFSRAISGQYPPGSTFKLLVAAAGLDAGVITEKTHVLSTGGVRIGRFFFPDWKAGGHGTVDVRSAIAWSVNTFFYIVGGGLGDVPGLGIERMGAMAKQFGIGQKTGIDLPSEATGFFPTPAWKEKTKGEMWYIGDTYHASIGQGDVLLTPLQVTSLTSAIANGGTRYAPRLVERILRKNTQEVIEPSVQGPAVATPNALRIVREGMRQTVTHGSAKLLQSLPIAVAGKTGTAQWRQGASTHAWFTGFAPFENPELVLTVLVEEGGEGSAISVPLAKDIFLWWYQNRSIKSP